MIDAKTASPGKQRLLGLSPTSLPVRFFFAFRYPLLIFLVVEVIGSLVFWIISGYKASALDCIYMVFITVATIGFGETIDLAPYPMGRVFLMGIATVGIANVTGDDGKNLLITLSAKQLNPGTRVVARLHDIRNADKLKRVGADAIVSPDFTGGMRIASSMLRPAVVSFLDEMLRTDEKLRVEEVAVPEAFAQRSITDVVPPSGEYMVLAVRGASGWQFNPPADFRLQSGNTLVVMVTPEGRRQLERAMTG